MRPYFTQVGTQQNVLLSHARNQTRVVWRKVATQHAATTYWVSYGTHRQCQRTTSKTLPTARKLWRLYKGQENRTGKLKEKQRNLEVRFFSTRSIGPESSCRTSDADKSTRPGVLSSLFGPTPPYTEPCSALQRAFLRSLELPVHSTFPNTIVTRTILYPIFCSSCTFCVQYTYVTEFFRVIGWCLHRWPMTVRIKGANVRKQITKETLFLSNYFQNQ